MASRGLQQLVDLTRGLSEAVAHSARTAGTWRRLWERFANRTGQTSADAFADAMAQAVTCGHYHLASEAGPQLAGPARTWLRAAAAEPLLTAVWRLCLPSDRARRASDPVTRTSRRLAEHLERCAPHLAAEQPFRLGSESSRWPGLDFGERFLQVYDRSARRRHGVYYTPAELACFVVRQVDTSLRDELGLDQGLADTRTWQDLGAHAEPCLPADSARSASPFIRILDPAMGAGIFLLEIIAHLHRSWERGAARGAASSPGAALTWDAFVNRVMLPRLWGQDVLLSAVVSAQLMVTRHLVSTGYTFCTPAPLELHLGNTLQVPCVGREMLPSPATPFTVIVGNPPFAGLSQHQAPWLRQLLRGRSPDGRAVSDYLRVAGQALGERKHWLDDDYVKFLRVAHWLIETAGAGVVALVTNHAFLDNVTFRGLRAAVLETFPRVTVLDLHGNSRAAGRAPDGAPDESVFGIEQGIAVSLLRRPLAGCAPRRVMHGELWGTRASKLTALDRAAPPATVPLTPRAPHYLLAPQELDHEAEYLRGHRLPDIMPVHGTAAVTARDSVVVAFTAEELQQRIAALRDEAIPDAWIRQQYFATSRSPRYAPGDTRGWSLEAARQRLRQATHLDQCVRDCLYRPFDWRKIFWTPWMIDWPRDRLMSALLMGENLALVTRRQSPAAQEWTYAWITDTIALDGLIRSDNRGSESVFPLFATPPPSAAGHAPGTRPQADATPSMAQPNFSADFVQAVAQATGLRWTPAETVARRDRFTPHALLYYVYALFHAPSYRKRYAPWLRSDFPRVFVPASAAVFRELTALGARLAASHLLRDDQTPPALTTPAPLPESTKAGTPRFQERAIHINSDVRVAPVSRGTWEFRVGSYQVCKKWLQDRRGRLITADEWGQYGRLVAAVRQTRERMRDIQGAIDVHGGWGRAFVGDDAHSASSSASRVGS